MNEELMTNEVLEAEVIEAEVEEEVEVTEYKPEIDEVYDYEENGLAALAILGAIGAGVIGAGATLFKNRKRVSGFVTNKIVGWVEKKGYIVTKEDEVIEAEEVEAEEVEVQETEEV